MRDRNNTVVGAHSVMQDITERKDARKLLQKSEAELRTLTESTSTAIFIYQDEKLRYVNSATEVITGYRQEELYAMNFRDLVHPDFLELIQESWLSQQGVEPVPFREFKILTKSGEQRWIDFSAGGIEFEGKPAILATAIDVTERKQAQEALRESEDRYARAVRGANDGLWDWNLKTGQIYFSPRWKSMLGYGETEIGNSPEDWFSRVHPEDLGRLKVEIGAHLEGPHTHFESEHRMLHKDGVYLWMLSRGLAVLDADGKASRMAGSLTDITMRKLAEQRLLHDAFHDELTGLPNRTLFMERLERASVRAMRRDNYLFAVLFLDLDRFKVINDSLGHLIGDQLLIGIARRLQGCLRPEDTVARLGGDEFVILFDDLRSTGDATQLAERIQKELSWPFNLSGREVFTSVSIGIALSTTGHDDPEGLLRDADTVMYRAKALGKARHEVFQKGMHTRAVERLWLETDLRRAIERQEFQLHYQPIVSRESGEITSIEALVRWQHPNRGLIYPEQFIAVAEETGVVLPLGEWVLRTACAQNMAWQAAGLPHVRVAVNVSARQFKQPNLVEIITRALDETGLDSHFLELELTEGIVLNSAEAALETLQLLYSMGVRISIDDFGTGYSSLRCLRRPPISTLKIDQSFVQDIDVDVDGSAITAAVINLGHSLKMNVVAEGVETPEQFELLCSLGCSQLQGHLFSEPVPAERLAALLAKRYLTPSPAAIQRIRRHAALLNPSLPLPGRPAVLLPAWSSSAGESRATGRGTGG